MRMTPAMRRFLRRFPKPPQPPKGMMWRGNDLVPAEAIQQHFIEKMRGFDQLPLRQRKVIWESVTGYFVPPPSHASTVSARRSRS